MSQSHSLHLHIMSSELYIKCIRSSVYFLVLKMYGYSFHFYVKTKVKVWRASFSSCSHLRDTRLIRNTDITVCFTSLDSTSNIIWTLSGSKVHVWVLRILGVKSLKASPAPTSTCFPFKFSRSCLSGHLSRFRESMGTTGSAYMSLMCHVLGLKYVWLWAVSHV